MNGNMVSSWWSLKLHDIHETTKTCIESREKQNKQGTCREKNYQKNIAEWHSSDKCCHCDQRGNTEIGGFQNGREKDRCRAILC